MLKGIGPAALKELASLPSFEVASINDLAKLNTKIGKKLNKALDLPNAWEKAEASVEAEIESCVRLGARVVCVLDDDYPQLLRETPDSPFFLYILGRLAEQSSKSVAVIGTRQPTEHGKLMTERITDYLIDDGWSIVSGLALGCDIFAHQRALAKNGHTIAVLAHGLHTIAPKQHQEQAKKIVDQGGALVTEYGFGVEPFAPQYVKRDRIQAGLVRGVLMIQSDVHGGSLHASRAAVEYKRLLAVPYPTERDIANGEPKIEANLILVGGSQMEKKKLLSCSEDELKKLFIFRGKDDYSKLSNALES
jgi:DNA protecting protein DprA